MEIFTNSFKEEMKKQLLQELRAVAAKVEPSPFLSRRETAKMLGVTVETIGQWTKEGKLTAHKANTRLRYSREDLNNFIVPAKAIK